MLRDHRVKVTPGVCRENRAEIADGKKQSKRENDTGDCNSPDLESQTHCWFSWLLR